MRRVSVLLAALAVPLLTVPVPANAQSLSDAAFQSDEAPNGHAHVSEEMLNAILAQHVEQSAELRDYMMGAFTTGRAELTGFVQAKFVPSDSQGIIEIELAGRSVAQNSSNYRDRVQIRSSAHTDVHAAKQLVVTPAGFRTRPARAWCPTVVRVQDVDARLRLVERFAWRRLCKKRGEMQADASRQAADRISEQLDEQAAKPLANANRTYREQIKQALDDRGAFPRAMRVSTTGNLLQLALLQRGAGQRSRPGEAKQADPSLDIGIAAHESLIENLTESFFGGGTIADEAFLEVVKTMQGQAPRALWVFERRPRWSITLREKQPLRVHFDGAADTFQLALFATRVDNGENSYQGPVQIEASYHMEITPHGPHLVRSEPLVVRLQDAPEADAATPEEPTDAQEWRGFLERKFSAFFGKDIYFDGLMPPQGGQLAKLRDLRLAELSASGGWFTIGYQLPEERVAAQNKKSGRKRE